METKNDFAELVILIDCLKEHLKSWDWSLTYSSGRGLEFAHKNDGDKPKGQIRVEVVEGR